MGNIDSSLGALHVLVVDDDATVLRAVCATIRRIAPTRTASGVAEARALLDGTRDWLALVVDYAMGDGNGLEVVAEARRLEVVAPALLLTAMTPRSVRDRALLEGIHFMEKPFEPEELRAFIRAAHSGVLPIVSA